MSNALESIKARDEARKAAAMSSTGNDESRKGLSAQFLSDFEKLSNETRGLIASNSLDKASESIAAMKKALSESVTILSAYDIRTSQGVIDKHQEALLNARKTLNPAKKFTFKSRQKHTAASKGEDTKSSQPQPSPSTTWEEWGCDGFKDRKKETLTWPIKEGRETEEKGKENGNRKDFALCNLEECTVDVRECFTALHISNLSGCEVCVAPVNGSIWVDKCRECTLTLAGHQIRIHETHDSTFCVVARSDPIIEDCTGLTFTPNAVATRDELVACGIDMDNRAHAECWMHVKDFKWLNSEEQSPNWTFKK